MKKISYKIRYSVVSALVFMFVLFSCSSSNSTTPMNNPGGNNTGGGNAVTIQNFAFTPATLTVPVNTTVTWTNKDGTSHTVTSDTGLFDSGSVASNGSYSFKFTAVGTYNYHCTIHPNMTAKVVVQ